MGRFDNMTIWGAAVAAYGSEEEADGFMENPHRGSVAEAVLGDPDAYVYPDLITEPNEKQRMLKYLEKIASRNRGPA